MFSCIPLRRWRYWLQPNLPEGLLRAMRLYSDFVSQAESERDWRAWWSRRILPGGRNSAGDPPQWSPGLVLCPFFTVPSQYRLVFLLSHHPRETGILEFGDGLAQWSEVLARGGQ